MNIDFRKQAVEWKSKQLLFNDIITELYNGINSQTGIKIEKEYKKYLETADLKYCVVQFVANKEMVFIVENSENITHVGGEEFAKTLFYSDSEEECKQFMELLKPVKIGREDLYNLIDSVIYDLINDDNDPILYPSISGNSIYIKKDDNYEEVLKEKINEYLKQQR